jgi:hypothetical protein
MSASPAIGIGRNLENSNYSGISIQDYLFDPSGRGLRLTEHTLGGLVSISHQQAWVRDLNNSNSSGTNIQKIGMGRNL